MDRTELLNAGDRLSYRIVESIYLANGTTSRAAISQQLQVPLATLNRYLQRLTVDLKPWVDTHQITWTVSKTEVHLELHGHTNIYKLVFDQQIMTADSYQILMYLYNHDFHFQFWQLAADLHLSEATATRKVNALNQLLHEFDLVIYRGELKGSKFQITWFYYKLFRELHINQPEIASSDIITSRLQDSGLRLDALMVDRLHEWLAIMVHVENKAVAGTNFLSPVDQTLTNDTQLLAVVERTALQMTASEQVSLAIFLLLHSSAVIADDDLNGWIGLGKTKNQKLLQNLQQVRRQFMHGQPASYQTALSITKLFSMFVVPMIGIGDIGHFDDLGFDHLVELTLPESGRQGLHMFKQRLLATTNGEVKQAISQHWSFLSQRLLPFYALMTTSVRPQRHIGLALGTSIELTTLFGQRLVTALAPAIRARIEQYDHRRNYDLVIKNEHNRQLIDETQLSYEISDMGNESDFQSILTKMM